MPQKRQTRPGTAPPSGGSGPSRRNRQSGAGPGHDASDAALPLASDLAEARWQAVLDTARDAIISIDEAGIVRLFNHSAEQIFGYAAKEVLGQNVMILMPAPYREEHDRYIERYKKTRVKKAIGMIRAVEGRRKDGTVFPIELAVSEARSGDEVLFTAIIRDVSERLRALAEFRDLQRLAQQRERLADVGAITAKIIHDFGNPLSALSLQTQLIRRRLQRDPSASLSSVAATFEQIVFESRRLESLVREFMEFTGEQRLEVVPIDLRGFLTAVIEAWRPNAEGRGIDLGIEAPERLEAVRGDPEKLRRVFDNLVKNALEAIDRGPGRVVLRVDFPTTAKLRISVEDSGPGISERIHVFHLFESTKPYGTGLGLSVAKEIILAHGGAIGFERREPHGTVFQVDLPYGGASV